MKILHVLFGMPPYATGGLPLYVKGLVEQQLKDSNEVYIFEPGSMVGKKKIYHVKNTNIFRLNGAMQVTYNFGLNSPYKYIKKYDIDIFNNFFKENKFDIINVHSFMGIPIEFFKAARDNKIKIIYTTHDYYGLCLRTNFINNKNDICNPNKENDCSSCNYCIGLSRKKSIVMQNSIYKKYKNNKLLKKFRQKQRSSLKKSEQLDVKVSSDIVKEYNKIKNYNIDIFKHFNFYIYNSEITKNIFEKTLRSNGEICQILLPDIVKKNIDYKVSKKKLTFIGRKEFYKGASLLKEVIEKDTSYECNFYGDDYSDLLSDVDNCNNKGAFKRNELDKIFSETSLLIVPSLWYETFGFVTLEALSYGIPVIVSSRVGSGYLLSDCPFNVIFNPDHRSLKECIDYLFEDDRLQQYRSWILKQNYCFDMNKHSMEIKKIYQKVINSD